MVIPDSSAWIEFLRQTESPQHHAVRDLLQANDGELCTTGPVVMEIAYGARDSAERGMLERLLARARSVQCRDPEDFAVAAEIRAAVRPAADARLPAYNDCLIAAVALRAGASVLHRDRDFDVIAAVTGLRVTT